MESIIISSKEDRMMCYTDRRDLYLQLHSSLSAKTEGLVRGNNKLIADFSVCGETRFENAETELRPDSFTITFKNSGAKITCALLRDALYFYAETFGTAEGLVLSANPEFDARLDSFIGIASSSYFTVSTMPGDRSLRKICFAPQTPLYISFRRNVHEADQHVADLLANNGFEQHCQYVHQTLSTCSIDTGNALCNKALEWSTFSGLCFVTSKNKVSGIWAGLPWFRDNWGRDTFISLPGILFVNGQYTVARDVIKGFLQYQDKDPESSTYGRIPNRYNGTSIIYNTADGPLWLIREILEYAQYTGDLAFLNEVWDSIQLSIETDIARRTDNFGFLRHGNADTWMDARIAGKKAWSPRGNRAVDVQVLWYTALECAADIAKLLNKTKEQDTYHTLAQKLKSNFLPFFWNGVFMADYIDSQGHGDYRLRPNQLMLLTVPYGCEPFISADIAKKITETTVSELLFPYGICSLSQKDCYFHPYHDNCSMYHKDAAYHNGTIWGWNAGFTIGALCMTGHTELAWQFTKNLANQIINIGCAGTMSENLSAYPDETGAIHPSGTWSQAWSDAEFNRVFWQYYLGIYPELLYDRVSVAPHFPDDWLSGSAETALGTGDKECRLLVQWTPLTITVTLKTEHPLALKFICNSLCGQKTTVIKANESIQISRKAFVTKKTETLSFAEPNRLSGSGNEPPCLKQQDYLAKAILSDYGISEV